MQLQVLILESLDVCAVRFDGLGQRGDSIALVAELKVKRPREKKLEVA